MNVNRVVLAGNITKDPEEFVGASGNKKVNMRLAVNRRYTHNDEKKEETTFVNIVVWGKTADFCKQYLKKGSGILVTGRLSIRSYEKEGQTHYMTEVVAAEVQSFGAKQTVG